MPQHAIRPPLAHQAYHRRTVEAHTAAGADGGRFAAPAGLGQGNGLQLAVALLHNNWAQLRCRDLFAGTGALGFEAASHGVAQWTMVEYTHPVVRQLESTKAKLGAERVQILRSDAIAAAEKLAINAAAGPGRFDLVFLVPDGLRYLKAEWALDGETRPDWLAGWKPLRVDHAGSVFYHLLTRQSSLVETAMASEGLLRIQA